MKKEKIISIVLFTSIIFLPLILLNTEANSVSLIDNRTLTENPFSLEGDLTENIEDYVNDRIGLRDEMITAYTVLNDRLFTKMVHPSYSYGKDGYVFGAGLTTENEFSDFHIAFADMVEEIQDYCLDRDVPFLFVFNPAKPAVYQDKIKDGVNYNREWVGLFFDELDKRNINYLDNTDTFIALREEGIEGFNQKYDANHWNDLGAFYGTQAMLESLNQMNDSIELNDLKDLSYSEDLQTSLLVSKFPINEKTPKIGLKAGIENLLGDYSEELDLDDSYKAFAYYLNPGLENSDTPKVLCFQGSYMNDLGDRFLANALEEIICVHNYQNVINFPYYFNIFEPDCVVLEIAEYTFAENYFNFEDMKNVDYAPVLSKLDDDSYIYVDIEAENIKLERGKTLTTITWETETDYPYAWISLDKIYDMQKLEDGYSVTIGNDQYDLSDKDFEIYIAE